MRLVYNVKKWPLFGSHYIGLLGKKMVRRGLWNLQFKKWFSIWGSGPTGGLHTAWLRGHPMDYQS